MGSITGPTPLPVSNGTESAFGGGVNLAHAAGVMAAAGTVSIVE